MDPITIDLTSVSGIVLATVTIIHVFKARIGQLPYLRDVPLFVYVVAVSSGLTWLAYDVLHAIDGDRTSLMVQAVLQALAASGAVEWYRAGGKATSDTSKARMARLGAVLLAVGLTLSACASVGTTLAESDRGIHATLSAVDDFINRACDAKLRNDADCKAFNALIADGWGAYRRFNAAAQEGSIAGVPSMVNAISDIRAAALKLEPQGHALLDDLRKWADALKALLPQKETGNAK